MEVQQLFIFFCLLIGAIVLFLIFKRLIEQSKNPTGILGMWMMNIWNRAYLPMVKWTFKYITVYPPKNVLDIGIGNGASTNLIRKHFPTSTIYGIDCSSTAVKEARKRNREDVIIKQEKIEETDLPTNFFELVFAFQTHFHWEKLDQSFSEIKRILAQEGELWIACEQTKVNYFLPNLVEEEHLRAYLNDLGLELVDIYQTTPWVCYRIMNYTSQ